MKVKGEIMKRRVSDLLKEKGESVYTITDDKKLKDVVKIFNEKHIGALMVLNDKDEIQGIITERDILRKLARTEGEIKDICVRFVMTPKENLTVGTLEDTLEYLMKMMTLNRFRHVPIVAGEEVPRLRGIISIGDIVKALLHDLNIDGKYMKGMAY
jgi:CBS domain-containing protein